MNSSDIKALREHLDMDQREFALLLGCYQHHVSRWENGVTPRGKWQTILGMIDYTKDTPEMAERVRRAKAIQLAEGYTGGPRRR